MCVRLLALAIKSIWQQHLGRRSATRGRHCHNAAGAAAGKSFHFSVDLYSTSLMRLFDIMWAKLAESLKCDYQIICNWRAVGGVDVEISVTSLSYHTISDDAIIEWNVL